MAARSAPRLAWLAAAAWALGCDTGAVGISECREIETARCHAARACDAIDNVNACLRFHRDHCLHGLPAKRAPRAQDLNRCVQALGAAKECAARDRDARSSECDGIAALAEGEDPSVCELVERPEGARQCDFLVQAEPDETEEDDPPQASGDESVDAGATAAQAR